MAKDIRLVGIRVEKAELPLAGLGAVYIFNDEIAYRNKPGQQIGTHSGFCVTVGTKPVPLYLCQAVFTLPDGQITARGLFSDTDQPPVRAAISGGTRKYRKIRGEVRVREKTMSDGTIISHFTIRHWL
jgi:hypothetical protein